MEDKLKVATEEQFGNTTDLYDKMKKLQKHQAFEAEIVANADRISSIKQVHIRCLVIEAISVPSDGFQIYYLQSSLFVISKECS